MWLIITTEQAAVSIKCNERESVLKIAKENVISKLQLNSYVFMGFISNISRVTEILLFEHILY